VLPHAAETHIVAHVRALGTSSVQKAAAGQKLQKQHIASAARGRALPSSIAANVSPASDAK